jgi:hypothetical protein
MLCDTKLFGPRDITGANWHRREPPETILFSPDEAGAEVRQIVASGRRVASIGPWKGRARHPWILPGDVWHVMGNDDSEADEQAAAFLLGDTWSESEAGPSGSVGQRGSARLANRFLTRSNRCRSL